MLRQFFFSSSSMISRFAAGLRPWIASPACASSWASLSSYSWSRACQAVISFLCVSSCHFSIARSVRWHLTSIAMAICAMWYVLIATGTEPCSSAMVVDDTNMPFVSRTGRCPTMTSSTQSPPQLLYTAPTLAHTAR